MGSGTVTAEAKAVPVPAIIAITQNIEISTGFFIASPSYPAFGFKINDSLVAFDTLVSSIQFAITMPQAYIIDIIN